VRLSGRISLRAWLSAVSLAGLALCAIAASPWRELRPRARALAFSARSGPESARLSGSAFAFDRAYGEFLEAVRRRTPPNSTVAVAIPKEEEGYLYTAAYVLAPRRIVSEDRLGEADFAAGYRMNALPGGQARPIAHGALARVR